MKGISALLVKRIAFLQVLSPVLGCAGISEKRTGARGQSQKREQRREASLQSQWKTPAAGLVYGQLQRELPGAPGGS